MINLQEHISQSTNPTAKKLWHIMATKQSNLAASADLTTAAALLNFANSVGPEICMLKTHIDIVEDFKLDLVKALQDLANKHQFIIFEDRKFADIGNTVQLQYSKGIYHIADWAELTNAHILFGPGLIQGLKEVGLPKGNGLLLLAELSTKGNLITPSYTETAVKFAEQHQDFVIGFISQHRLTTNSAFIHATPGVHLASSGDNLGQQYQTPEQAIIEKGNDIIIVGRGIYASNDPKGMAQRYREAGWQALLQRGK